jgi:hypothetical protein
MHHPKAKHPYTSRKARAVERPSEEEASPRKQQAGDDENAVPMN